MKTLVIEERIKVEFPTDQEPNADRDTNIAFGFLYAESILAQYGLTIDNVTLKPVE